MPLPAWAEVEKIDCTKNGVHGDARVVELHEDFRHGNGLHRVALECSVCGLKFVAQVGLHPPEGWERVRK